MSDHAVQDAARPLQADEPEPTSRSRTRARKGASLRPRKEASGDLSKPVTTFQPVLAGQWIEAGQIRDWALEQMGIAGSAEFTAVSPDGSLLTHPTDKFALAKAGLQSLTFDLEGVDYLEASALQVLLAVDAELVKRGGRLHFVNRSAQLEQWFEFAGAGGRFLTPPETIIEANGGTEDGRCEKS